MSEFSDNLREARNRAGFTQKALSAEVGASQATISQLERGKKNPSFELLERLAKALGVSQGYLLGDPQIGLSREEETYLIQLRGLSRLAREKLRRYGEDLWNQEP